jgi:hypothetical protein
LQCDGNIVVDEAFSSVKEGFSDKAKSGIYGAQRNVSIRKTRLKNQDWVVGCHRMCYQMFGCASVIRGLSGGTTVRRSQLDGDARGSMCGLFALDVSDAALAHANLGGDTHEGARAHLTADIGDQSLGGAVMPVHIGQKFEKRLSTIFAQIAPPPHQEAHRLSLGRNVAKALRALAEADVIRAAAAVRAVRGLRDILRVDAVLAVGFLDPEDPPVGEFEVRQHRFDPFTIVVAWRASRTYLYQTPSGQQDQRQVNEDDRLNVEGRLHEFPLPRLPIEHCAYRKS